MSQTALLSTLWFLGQRLRLRNEVASLEMGLQELPGSKNSGSDLLAQQLPRMLHSPGEAAAEAPIETKGEVSAATESSSSSTTSAITAAEQMLWRFGRVHDHEMLQNPWF